MRKEENDMVGEVQQIKTKAGIEIERIEFESFGEVEEYFIEHMDEFSAGGYSTKVIGTVLMKFKKR